MFVVDTNVLVYAVNRSVPEHEACARRLLAWARDPSPWYVTWGIVYEFLRVCTHSRVFAEPLSTAQAWQFLDVLLAAPGLRLLTEGPHHADVARTTFLEVPGLRGNLVHDAKTAVLMREHGVSEIWTRDGDFHRFPFLTVRDPLGT